MNVLPKSKEKADLEKSKELAFIDYESRMDLPWRFASGLIAAPMIPLCKYYSVGSRDTTSRNPQNILRSNLLTRN